jgi:hypothetical protein
VRPEGAAAHRDGHDRVSCSGKVAGYGSGAHDEEGLRASQSVHSIQRWSGGGLLMILVALALSARGEENSKLGLWPGANPGGVGLAIGAGCKRSRARDTVA